MPVVSALHLYPIKSCRGFSVPAARLDSFGLEHDRRFLVVDVTGHFLSQRSMPRMALVETALHPRDLVVSAPGLRELHVPLPHADEHAPEATVKVTVWRDTVEARDLGDEAADWFRRALGHRCRLVHTGPRFARRLPVARVPAVHRDVLTDVPVAFSDAFPLLALTDESLSDLNARLTVPLPMDRFRPNVVVRGAAAYDEDRWQTVRIAGVIFRAGGPCLRCTVTTNDQSTGRHGKEPLRTLAKYRRAPDGHVMFGQNWIHSGAGALRVGDLVEVID